MKQTLIFATNNHHKLEEVSDMMEGSGLCLTTLREAGIVEDIPEEEPTIEGNALAKARYVWERTGTDCFADDTGLEVSALGGAPGVRSARYAADLLAGRPDGSPARDRLPCPHADAARVSSGHDFEANVGLLLRNMEDVADRSARFRTVIALILDGHEYTFEGIVEGRITEVRSGEGGFGYDPVFIPAGHEQSFAEMPVELKNSISHRALAVQKFIKFLKNTQNNGSRL
jgi:XTP/dITP diphosphohydrolase